MLDSTDISIDEAKAIAIYARVASAVRRYRISCYIVHGRVNNGALSSKQLAPVLVVCHSC